MKKSLLTKSGDFFVMKRTQSVHEELRNEAVFLLKTMKRKLRLHYGINL